MFRRASWFAAGAAAGVGSAVWAQRTVKRTASRLAPGHVATTAVEAVRDRGRDLAEAVREGRAAMVAKERELKAHRDAEELVHGHGGQIVEGQLGGRPVRLVVLPGEQPVVDVTDEPRPDGRPGAGRRRSRR